MSHSLRILWSAAGLAATVSIAVAAGGGGGGGAGGGAAARPWPAVGLAAAARSGAAERWAPPVAVQAAAERSALAGQALPEPSDPGTLAEERLLAQVPGQATQEQKVGAPLLAGET